VDDRVEALLASMSLDEKASFTAGEDMWHLPAIDRLGIGRLKVSDGPSGVRGQYIGTRQSLSFPCGLAAGATWDVELIERYGGAIAQEARAKGVHVVLGPTVCIPRMPLAGRTFESFSEDPLLSAGVTSAYVRGVQRGGVGCCVKHFACNDQEHERMTISAEVDERTLREVHLRPFEAAVRDAGVWAVMSAYNRVNGTYCGEHPHLLGEILKGEWGFDGVVMSDWFGTHGTLEAAIAGLDVEMPGPPRHLGRHLADAVRDGRLDEGVVDDKARRVLRLAVRTGLLDHPPSDSEPQDPDVTARRAIARELAIESTVLLRNDGVLPLDPAVRQVAVIGPNADLLVTGGGGSASFVPRRFVSFVDELRARLPGAAIVYERGCGIARWLPAVDPRLLVDGLHVEYFANDRFEGEPVGHDIARTGFCRMLGSPSPDVDAGEVSLRARGVLRPEVSGPWTLGLGRGGPGRLLVDGRVVVDAQDGGVAAGEVELAAGEDHELVIEVAATPTQVPGFDLRAARPAVADELDRAVDTAAAADVAVVVVGLDPGWEREGKDRPDLRLPGAQEDLVRAVITANPRTVVVVNAGAPVDLACASGAAALLTVWYPGEEGAAALAAVLTGAAEPAGRLPITFPARVEDLAAHGWYPGTEGRVTYGEGLFVGYRHYEAAGIEPAFCFGHGLGYTTFEQLGATVQVRDGTAVVRVEVANRGDRPGAEVVQVYARPAADGDGAASAPRLPVQLAAFAKVRLDAGSRTTVELPVDERALSWWDPAAGRWRLADGTVELRVGSSSRAIHHRLALDVTSRGMRAPA